MIDTDKYEGHTPAPWLWMEWNTWLAGGNEEGEDGKFLVQRPIEVADKDEVDGLLIADAPLLLAEVKRLQYWDEEMNRVIATLDEHNWASSDGDVHDIVTHNLAEVKRYKEVFDRAIECALNDNAEQAMQFLLNMEYCLDDEEKVTDKNRHKYTWVNGEWRNKE